MGIKNAVKGIIKDHTGAIVSGMKANSMEKKLVSSLNNKIGPTSTVGRVNYNAQAAVLKGRVQKGDLQGARDYAVSQRDKYNKQVMKGKK